MLLFRYELILSDFELFVKWKASKISDVSETVFEIHFQINNCITNKQPPNGDCSNVFHFNSLPQLLTKSHKIKSTGNKVTVHCAFYAYCMIIFILNILIKLPIQELLIAANIQHKQYYHNTLDWTLLMATQRNLLQEV